MPKRLFLAPIEVEILFIVFEISISTALDVTKQ